MNKKSLRAQILEILRKQPGGKIKAKDLAKKFKTAGSDTMDAVLHDLVLEGVMYKKGKNYHLLENRLIGRISVSKRREGYVRVEGIADEYYVAAHHLRTALDGDRVMIIPLERRRARRRLEAEVAEVIERGRSRLVGTYKNDRNLEYVIPDDLRFQRDILVTYKDLKPADGQKVVVTLDDWTDEHLNPRGHITEILGFPSEPGVDVLSVVKAHDIRFGFPPEVETACAAADEAIPDSEISRRLDIRNWLTVTIDPADAKDFDDAVSLLTLPENLFLLGVHIADVSYYVPEDSIIDKEAYTRGTSTYLVDRVIPMLPERLSNNLCSLRPDADRLTYSILMTLDMRGNILDYDIEESVIHSRRRFTYEEVQSVIEGQRVENVSPEIIDMILQMNKLSKILTRKRLAEGSLDFDTPEAKFVLDTAGHPVACYRKDRLDSHRLVEEFMLAANRTAAAHIGKPVNKAEPGPERPFLYRVHDKPPAEKMENFFGLLKALGVNPGFSKDFSKLRAGQLQMMMNKIRRHKYYPLVEKVAIRSMSKAVYSPVNIGHFGLGFDYYTHFTSPIRRYPDLVVHRLLKAYSRGMTAERRDWLEDNLDSIGRHCSEREQIAADAERESVKVKQVEFMLDKIGEEYDAVISGVMAFGIFVEIPEYLIEGLIHIRDIDDDYYIYDEKQYQIKGKRRHRTLRLGDTVRVRLIRVNREKNEIDFMLTD